MSVAPGTVSDIAPAKYYDAALKQYSKDIKRLENINPVLCIEQLQKEDFLLQAQVKELKKVARHGRYEGLRRLNEYVSLLPDAGQRFFVDSCLEGEPNLVKKIRKYSREEVLRLRATHIDRGSTVEQSAPPPDITQAVAATRNKVCFTLLCLDSVYRGIISKRYLFCCICYQSRHPGYLPVFVDIAINLAFVAYLWCIHDVFVAYSWRIRYNLIDLLVLLTVFKLFSRTSMFSSCPRTSLRHLHQISLMRKTVLLSPIVSLAWTLMGKALRV